MNRGIENMTYEKTVKDLGLFSLVKTEGRHYNSLQIYKEKAINSSLCPLALKEVVGLCIFTIWRSRLDIRKNFVTLRIVNY